MRALLVTTLVALALSCTKMSLKDEETIVLGTHAAYPPYEMVNEKGDIVGFDIDVAKAVAVKLGKKLIVHNMNFDALILALKQGKFDLIMAGISITASRQKEIVLLPYQGAQVRSLSLLFWDKAPQGIVGIKDLKGKTVVVQSGTQMENYLTSEKEVHAKALEGTIELVMDIKYGKSAAALVEPHIADEVTKKHLQLKRVDFALPQDAWVLGNGVGIRKNNSALIGEVQRALDQLKKEGVIAQLEAKWFHLSPS